MGELRSTVFGGGIGGGDKNSDDRRIAAVAVASRRQLCVNADALAVGGSSGARLNERCLELGEEARKRGPGKTKELGKEDGAKETTQKGKKTQEKQKGCPFLAKRRAAVSELAEEILATPMDIEDLATAGVKRKACPYYASRQAHPRADIIFAPYASLLHPETRQSLGIELKNAVVIFDEAHNLADAVHGAFGAQLTGAQIVSVEKMLANYTVHISHHVPPP